MHQIAKLSDPIIIPCDLYHRYNYKIYLDKINKEIYTIKNANNKLELYDSQNGIVYDSSYLSKIKYKFDWSEDSNPPKILRVDNKELNKDILNRITKPARKK